MHRKKRLHRFTPAFVICLLGVSWIAEVPAYPAEGRKSVAAVSGDPTGLAFDGERVWYADRNRDVIVAVDLENGGAVDSLPSPGFWPAGLAWDGNNLWCADRESKKIYRIRGEDRVVDRIIDAPGPSPVGLAWDGRDLWVSDDVDDRLYRVSAVDGTMISSFDAPSGGSTGLCWDGRYLWAADRLEDEIYMVDPERGWVLLILDAPGAYTWGLAVADGAILAADMADDVVYDLPPAGGEKFRTDRPRKAAVTVTSQIRVEGPDPMLSVDAYFAVPQDRPNQRITAPIIYAPEPDRFITDRWGQRVAHFHYEDLTASSVVTTRMDVAAEITRIRYFIHPDSVQSDMKVPRESVNYLSDGDKYRINDPVIERAVDEAVGDEKRPYWVARRIYEYVMDHMYYELSGGWNVAPAVLERGNGSCSEYAFVMISMLRAAGIPARYVGSVVVRKDDVSFDEVFHRWVEFYLPGYGWVPADPSRGDKETPRARADSFGHVENSLLVTTESGGGSEYLGWNYNVDERVQFRGRSHHTVETIADWESTVARDENEQ